MGIRLRHDKKVSIHATLAGGDLASGYPAISVLSVSIHATLAGGDKLVSPSKTRSSTFLSTPPSRVATSAGLSWDSAEKFLSTPPSRVATCCAKPVTMRLSRFYPRHPRGWRLWDAYQEMMAQKFLSTPPSRVATGVDFSWFTRYNVSIHATLAGGDGIPGEAGIFFLEFLSTPPSRVATARRECGSAARNVSIHATLAGGDS